MPGLLLWTWQQDLQDELGTQLDLTSLGRAVFSRECTVCLQEMFEANCFMILDEEESTYEETTQYNPNGYLACCVTSTNSNFKGTFDS